MLRGEFDLRGRRMKIDKLLCPLGLKNNPNRAMRELTHITIHCTGNYNATAGALNHARYQLNGSGGRSASWHYTVDRDFIYQSFDDDRECWHAGNARGNSCSIGIEICVNDKPGFEIACNRAAWLVAFLVRKHNFNLDVIVQHCFWSGKNCPSELRSGVWGVTWESFLDMVKGYLGIFPAVLS